LQTNKQTNNKQTNKQTTREKGGRRLGGAPQAHIPSIDAVTMRGVFSIMMVSTSGDTWPVSVKSSCAPERAPATPQCAACTNASAAALRKQTNKPVAISRLCRHAALTPARPNRQLQSIYGRKLAGAVTFVSSGFQTLMQWSSPPEIRYLRGTGRSSPDKSVGARNGQRRRLIVAQPTMRSHRYSSE
jgi:hypothetical protein